MIEGALGPTDGGGAYPGRLLEAGADDEDDEGG